MKRNKGFIDGKIIITIVIILICIGVSGFGLFKWIYSVTAGNKAVVDMKYNFEKAIVYLGTMKLEIDIDKWSDYDGEQLQIIGKDGQVYLVSSFNTVLIGK